MRTKAISGLLAGLAALTVAGCGGSGGSKATPLPSETSVAAVDANPATTTPTSPTTLGRVKPSSADLSALSQQLDGAGHDIDDTGAAVAGTDVNAAKAEEGNAP